MVERDAGAPSGKSWLLIVLLTSAAGSGQAQTPEYSREDPAKIETAEKCGECHVAEYGVWKKTPHATGFKTLHRRQAAETIAEKMGFFLIKRESLCLRCHYTPTVQKEKLRAISGVSCESCHGAGADWIDDHNDYGGKGLDHSNEPPEHKAGRIEKSLAAGMRRPSDLYPVVANCFGCHTVPEEKLVNVGGHPAGSADFELVAWSQGEIRHNFLESFKTGDGTANAERPAATKRRMYVVGRALDLEYGLRGVAAASEKGTYLSAMIRRVRIASGELRAIGRRAELPEIDEMLAAVRGVQVGLGKRDALLSAAEGIGAATQRFLDRHDGTRLAAIDPLVLGTAEDEEEVVIAGDVDSPDAGAQVTPSPGSPAAGVEPAAGGPRPATAAAAPTSSARAAVPAVGEIKPRIRPRSQHQTIGPGKCTSCHRHSPQNEWWFQDRHFQSADPFFNEDPNNVRIATFYGIRRDRMTRGDQVCMDCHGTVVSGREKREINDGVSCESCHGAAAQFVEPHQEGDKALGEQRPGYRKALGLGMNELKDLDVRARACIGCHYVTDPRLISSGHPSGADFDYVGNMAKIRHWERPPAAAGALKAAFDRALDRRGGVPKVRLAQVAGSVPVSASAAGADTGGDGSASAARPFRPRTPAPRPAVRGGRRPSPATAAAGADPSPLGLPPFPEVDSSSSVEEVLLVLKERLRLLYEALGGQR
ncbi:MAG: multiheme c-type cytochrome [Thermoanaerobaculia bacterium]